MFAYTHNYLRTCRYNNTKNKYFHREFNYTGKFVHKNMLLISHKWFSNDIRMMNRMEKPVHLYGPITYKPNHKLKPTRKNP